MFEEMVGRTLPVPDVVTGSTPVVAFGDPRTATVATLGIKPSWRQPPRSAIDRRDERDRRTVEPRSRDRFRQPSRDQYGMAPLSPYEAEVSCEASLLH
jgi:hypothetical protein